MSFRRGVVTLVALLAAGTGTATGGVIDLSVIDPVGDDFIVVGGGENFYLSSSTSDRDVTSLTLMHEATFSVPQLDPATLGGRRLFRVWLTLPSDYALGAISFVEASVLTSASASASLGDMEMTVLLNGQPLFSKLDDTGGTDSCTTATSGLLNLESCTAAASLEGSFVEQVVMGPGAPFVGDETFDLTFRISAGATRGQLSPTSATDFNFFRVEGFWDAGLWVSYEIPEPGTLALVVLGGVGGAIHRRRRRS